MCSQKPYSDHFVHTDSTKIQKESDKLTRSFAGLTASPWTNKSRTNCQIIGWISLVPKKKLECRRMSNIGLLKAGALWSSCQKPFSSDKEINAKKNQKLDSMIVCMYHAFCVSLSRSLSLSLWLLLPSIDSEGDKLSA